LAEKAKKEFFNRSVLTREEKCSPTVEKKIVELLGALGLGGGGSSAAGKGKEEWSLKKDDLEDIYLSKNKKKPNEESGKYARHVEE